MRYSFLLLMLVFFFSCKQYTAEKDRIPILEVGGKFLYKDVLDKIIPKNANKIDSAEVADRFIKKWVTDVLLYENASRNIKNRDEIEQLVEEYRKSLIIYQYEQALVEERLNEKISEEELKAFYDSYKSQMPLQDNYVKGILLIIPKNAAQIGSVREWVRVPNEKSVELIEKYSLKNAISFDYFLDKWTPLNEILKKAPFKVEDSKSFALQRTYTEVSDSAKMYMLRIVNALPIGDIEPFEMARERTNGILLNKKKSEFIQQLEKSIYEDAVNEGSINYLNDKK